MALRTIGSTLQAKAAPGSRTREQEEFARSKPGIPGKGDVGTVSRGLIEEPLERQVSPGSAKMVSAQPTIEGSTVQPVLPPAPLTEGVGLPTTPQPLRSGAAGQALFQGGAAPTPQAQSVSGGAVAGAKPATANAPTPNAPVPVQGEAGSRLEGQNAPTTERFLGGGAIAAPPGTNIIKGQPTPLQQTVGSAGLGSNILGELARVGVLGPGASVLRSLIGQTGIAGNLQRYGGNPNISSIPSLGQVAGSVAKNVGQAISTGASNLRSKAQSAAQKATGFLRSLFGR